MHAHNLIAKQSTEQPHLTVVEPKSKMLPNQCAYVDWYRFNQCSIKTCKFYTVETKTHCLAIDREAPSGTKFISDAEIHLFKFKQDKISTRLVSMRRKAAVERVKAILILDEFISFIRKNHLPIKIKKNKQLKQIKKEYPFKIKELNFKSWMWRYVVSESEYAKFVKSKKEGDCKEFTLHQILGYTKEQLTSIQKLTEKIYVRRPEKDSKPLRLSTSHFKRN